MAPLVHLTHAASGDWSFRRRPRVAILILGGTDGAVRPLASWLRGFPTLELSVTGGEGADLALRNESGRWVARAPADAPQLGLYAGLEQAARHFFNAAFPESLQEWLLVVEGAHTVFFMETLLKQLDMFAGYVEHQLLLTDALSPTQRSLGCAAPAPCRSRLSCVRPESKLPPLAGCQRPAQAPCTRASILDAVCRYGALDKAASATAVPCLSAGAVLSRGLVLAFAYSDRHEQCVEEGADVFACLGNTVAVTDPGMYSESDFCAFGFMGGDQMVATAEKAQTALACDENCQRTLHDTVSMYTREASDTVAVSRLLSLQENVLTVLKQASASQLMRNLELARTERKGHPSRTAMCISRSSPTRLSPSGHA